MKQEVAPWCQRVTGQVLMGMNGEKCLCGCHQTPHKQHCNRRQTPSAERPECVNVVALSPLMSRLRLLAAARLFCCGVSPPAQRTLTMDEVHFYSTVLFSEVLISSRLRC